jgi:hypothetical protein
MQIASFLRRIELYPWPVLLYHILPRYHIKGKILREKKLNTTCGFLYSLQRFSETFLILREFGKIL